MSKRTYEGYLGIIILPDDRTMNRAVALSGKKHIRDASYRVEKSGVHVTLYQAKNFRGLPHSVAHRTVGLLNRYLVDHKNGAAPLHFGQVKASPGSTQYLFWYVDDPTTVRLRTAHAMSLGLGIWNHPEPSQDTNTQLFGSPYVELDYYPHITLAADAQGFPRLERFEERWTGTARCVVLARMGEWGKIEEILF
jgi:hypothetical protein